MAAHDTRAAKEKVAQRELTGAWHDQADAMGFSETVRRTLIADAKTRAAGLPVPTSRQRRLAADHVVTSASQHL